ncbi:MAG: FeoA family protein [Nanoarchaeota archaeon]
MKLLSDVKEGRTVKIKHVDCGMGLTRRLCELGLYDGTEIRVIRNHFSGPLVINVKDSRLVVGRGQAKQITVEDEKDNSSSGR